MMNQRSHATGRLCRRVMGVVVAACIVQWLATTSVYAQFPFLDPDDCTAIATDPACVPTATCTAFGNAPAIFDPASVVVTPLCTGGVLLGPVPDADGTSRHACLYAPAQASPANPLPLVVFLHPSLTPADAVQVTGLTTMTATADLTGDPARPGFILLAPAGRNTCHYYPTVDQRGPGWDNWYRNVDATDAEENVDVATIDHFIAERVASGTVDVERIYVTGWSNGAAMGYLYGLNRPSIAAVAVFSSPDPFRAFNDPCPQVPVAGVAVGTGDIQVVNPVVPTFHVHNDCDIAGLCPMGERLEAAIRALPGEADHLLINSLLLPATACNDLCGTNPNGDFNPCSSLLGYTLGVANHLRWPIIYNTAMLDFFRGHGLSSGGGSPPEPLTATLARVRGAIGSGGDGTATLRGTFPTTVAFDSSSVSVRVDDGLALDETRTFAGGECVAGALSGSIACRSADRRSRMQVKPVGAPPRMHRFRVRLRGLAATAPFAPPVTVTIADGSGPTTRMGTISTCVQTGYGLCCRGR